METGRAWADDGASRHRHLVGNRVVEQPDSGEIKARTAFILYRSHHETDANIFAGSREDILRRVEGTWKIAKRTIILDSNVILAKNLSVFF